MRDNISDFERLAEAERIISERASPVLARIARQVEEAYHVSLAGLRVTFNAADPAAGRGDDPGCVVVIAYLRRANGPSVTVGADARMTRPSSIWSPASWALTSSSGGARCSASLRATAWKCPGTRMDATGPYVPWRRAPCGLHWTTARPRTDACASCRAHTTDASTDI